MPQGDTAAALSRVARNSPFSNNVKPVTCPCLWKQVETGVRPVAIPRYNNENRWYIEKYQSILKEFS